MQPVPPAAAAAQLDGFHDTSLRLRRRHQRAVGTRRRSGNRHPPTPGAIQRRNARAGAPATHPLQPVRPPVLSEDREHLQGWITRHDILDALAHTVQSSEQSIEQGAVAADFGADDPSLAAHRSSTPLTGYQIVEITINADLSRDRTADRRDPLARRLSRGSRHQAENRRVIQHRHDPARRDASHPSRTHRHRKAAAEVGRDGLILYERIGGRWNAGRRIDDLLPWPKCPALSVDLGATPSANASPRHQKDRVCRRSPVLRADSRRQADAPVTRTQLPRPDPQRDLQVARCVTLETQRVIPRTGSPAVSCGPRAARRDALTSRPGELSLTRQRREHLGVALGRLHLPEDVSDLAVGIDHAWQRQPGRLHYLTPSSPPSRWAGTAAGAIAHACCQYREPLSRLGASVLKPRAQARTAG